MQNGFSFPIISLLLKLYQHYLNRQGMVPSENKSQSCAETRNLFFTAECKCKLCDAQMVLRTLVIHMFTQAFHIDEKCEMDLLFMSEI